jgi:hypothetical protein
VRVAHRLRVARQVDDREVERLEQVQLLRAHEVLPAELGDGPLDVAALDHRAELAEIDRRGVHHADSVAALELREVGAAEQARHGAAGGVDDDPVRLRRPAALRQGRCRQGTARGEEARRAEQRPAGGSDGQHGHALPVLLASLAGSAGAGS